MIYRTPRLTLHPFAVRDGLALHRQWNDQLLRALRPTHWVRGYATEASVAVLRLAFARGLRTIWAGADAPNRASFRLMRRLGFQRAGGFTVGGRPAIYYRIDRRRFANACGPRVSRAGSRAAVAPRLPRLRGARQSEGRG